MSIKIPLKCDDADANGIYSLSEFLSTDTISVINLGSGVANSNTFLSGDGYWKVIDIKYATTTTAGIVQLNDTTSSTSTSLAATANSVKTVYNLANAANINAANASYLTTGTVDVARLPTIPNSILENDLITINTGSGLSGGSSVSLGNSITISANSATTTSAGIVQLNDTTSSANTSLAATANSVKTVYNLANTANINAANASYLTTGTVGVARLPTIPNSILENNSITVSTGNGLSGGSTIALGNSITISANSATTTSAGIVQLNDTTSSANTSLAATANSVKTVYDLSLSKLNSSGGTISGDLIVSGNLTVNGDTTTLNTSTLAIEDNIIELRTGNNVISGDGGIQINLTTSPTGAVNTSRTIKWNNSANKFQLTNDGINYSNIIISSDLATTTTAGIVQLNDTTSSTSTSLAATANSVKTVYNLVNSVKTDASNASYLTTGTVGVARLPTIPNSILENDLITINTGSGLSGGSSVSLGNSITISANSATTTSAGIVQLNDTLTSSSTVLAATANTVKTLNDKISLTNIVGGTVVGNNIANLVNPNANSFIKINQDNSVRALNSGDFRTAIGAANILKIYKTDGTGINVSLENDTAGTATTNSSYIALTSGKLNQFTDTTSSELAGIITDETGTGNLVFSNNCILNNPIIKLTSNTIVANLSSELLNNQPGSYYTNASNLNSGKIPIGRLGDSGTANSSTYLRGDNTWQVVPFGMGISDTTNNATYYPTFVNVNTGTVSSVNTSSSKLYFNPSDGTLTSTNYSSLSDRNLKEDINLINNSLEILKLLQPVSFKWKDNGKKSYGLVAQEVQEILPELVETDSNGIKSVNYTALIPFLINAIVELSS